MIKLIQYIKVNNIIYSLNDDMYTIFVDCENIINHIKQSQLIIIIYILKLRLKILNNIYTYHNIFKNTEMPFLKTKFCAL